MEDSLAEREGAALLAWNEEHLARGGCLGGRQISPVDPASQVKGSDRSFLFRGITTWSSVLFGVVTSKKSSPVTSRPIWACRDSPSPGPTQRLRRVAGVVDDHPSPSLVWVSTVPRPTCKILFFAGPGVLRVGRRERRDPCLAAEVGVVRSLTLRWPFVGSLKVEPPVGPPLPRLAASGSGADGVSAPASRVGVRRYWGGPLRVQARDAGPLFRAPTWRRVASGRGPGGKSCARGLGWPPVGGTGVRLPRALTPATGLESDPCARGCGWCPPQGSVGGARPRVSVGRSRPV